MERGFDRQFNGAGVALVTAWTGLPFAMWLAAIGAVAGAVAGAIGGANSGFAHELHLSEATGVGAAVVGLFIGALGGFLLIYRAALEHPLSILGDVLSGFIVAVCTVAIIAQFEDQLLRLRRCRELSNREKQLFDPIVDDILSRMNITGARPRLYMSDKDKPEAWTHARSIVFTRGLLDYDESEGPPTPTLDPTAFAAVVAHEISHWKDADGLAVRAVWSCFWPLVAIYNFASMLSEPPGLDLMTLDASPRTPRRWFGVAAWFVFWPAWVSVQHVVVPVMAAGMRKCEYEADANAAALGEEFRLGLRRALTELQHWEAPRTGWEAALVATHPPIELRLERLETPPPRPTTGPPTVTISTPGLPDVHVSDPDVLEAGRLVAQAQEEGDTALLQTRERELHLATAAWFRRMRDAKGRGQQVDSDDSLDVLDARIADFALKAAGVSVTLSSASHGDIVCTDPAVVEAARAYEKATREDDDDVIATRNYELHDAIVGWLRSLKLALDNGDEVDVDITLDDVNERLADYERRAADLLPVDDEAEPTPPTRPRRATSKQSTTKRRKTATPRSNQPSESKDTTATRRRKRTPQTATPAEPADDAAERWRMPSDGEGRQRGEPTSDTDQTDST
jgi:Zn-dependent protease with chaperone function